MGGTREGGLYTKELLLEKYGKDYYRYIGQIGGRKGHTGGFYGNRDLASEAGRLGGMISKRRPADPRKKKRQREFNRVHKHLIRIGERARRQREREQRHSN